MLNSSEMQRFTFAKFLMKFSKFILCMKLVDIFRVIQLSLANLLKLVLKIEKVSFYFTYFPGSINQIAFVFFHWGWLTINHRRYFTPIAQL